MGTRKVADWGMDASKFLLTQLREGLLCPPADISMKRVADELGTSPQTIGMAIDTIRRIMKNKGYEIRPAGKPRVLQISMQKTEE